MKKAVYGIVSSSTQAEVVVTALKNPNFSNNDIALLLSDETGTIDFVRGNHTKAPEGAATGAGAGGLLGGGVGWLIGMGSLVIPGVGPFIAGGPIVAALSVAAVGAAWGGLTGALIGLEIPKYEAKIFEGKVSQGDFCSYSRRSGGVLKSYNFIFA